jgi:diguanylate cyclase (GGDEF)-like protein
MSSGGSTRRLSRRARLALLGGFLLVYFSWLAFRWIPLPNRLVGSLFYVPLNCAAVCAAWGASRRTGEIRRLRQAWCLIALGLTGYLAGGILSMFYEVVLHVKAYPTVADGVYLTFVPLMLAGILRFPAERRTRLRTFEIALDCLTVAIGGAVVFFYFVLTPSAIEAAGTPLQTAVSAAYPIGDMVLMVGVATVLLRGSRAVSRTPLLLMASGLGLFILADLIYGYLVLHSGYTTGDPVDVVYGSAMALLLCAGASQGRVERGQRGATAPPRRRPAWLPSGAVLAAFGVVTASELNEGFSAKQLLVILAGLLAALVMVRHHVSQRQLIAVQRQLQSAHDDMAVLATTDALTGLSNHRGFNAAIQRSLAAARRHGRPLAVLFIDVDHFKQLNDSAGHTAGDAALVEFAEVVGRCLRGSDVLTRWGGEEFVALLSEVPASGAQEVAERICSAVADHGFDAGGPARLTCSVGVASYPGDGADSASLVDTADRAMYLAKRLGRNRVVALNGRLAPPPRDPLTTDDRDAALDAA